MLDELKTLNWFHPISWLLASVQLVANPYYQKLFPNIPQNSYLENVIPPFLISVKSRGLINYNNCLGGTPPIAECGRSLL